MVRFPIEKISRPMDRRSGIPILNSTYQNIRRSFQSCAWRDVTSDVVSSDSRAATNWERQLGEGNGSSSSSTSSPKKSDSNPYAGITLDTRQPGEGAPIYDATRIHNKSIPDEKKNKFVDPFESLKFTKLRTNYNPRLHAIDPEGNTMRIVSFDKGGVASSLGLFVHTGSRYEKLPEEQGCSHLLELLAFRDTEHFSNFGIAKTFEKIGCQISTTVGRENLLYKADVLRESVPIVLPIMLSNFLTPKFRKEDVEDALIRVGETKMVLAQNPENFIVELLHQTAYSMSGLGSPLLGEDIDNLRSNLIPFHSKYARPGNLLLCGINVDHDQLVALSGECITDLSTDLISVSTEQCSTESPVLPNSLLPNNPPSKSVYTGGFLSSPVDGPGSDGYSHVAIALPVQGGWCGSSNYVDSARSGGGKDSSSALNGKEGGNSSVALDLIAATVLQSLLGGGGSFSTGGPGKGMHTRLFTNVLNRYYWIESCMAFSHIYSDDGIFGIYGKIPPNDKEVRNFSTVVMNTLFDLLQISEEELRRAKNSLKSSIYMNLETNAIALEDVGRQLLMSGKVLNGRDFAQLVEKVTVRDLKRVACKMLEKKPTVVHHGTMQNGDSPLDYAEIEFTCRKIRERLLASL